MKIKEKIKEKMNRMKMFGDRASGWLMVVALGLILLSPVSFARAAAMNDLASIPAAATAPLGESPAGNAALFDVVSAVANTGTGTSNSGPSIKIAPGELLPISVKLSNFGGGQKVDVLITYSILTSTGDEIYSTSDTVAVETTADFIKMVQIPSGTAPGIYTAQTSITYQGQLAPAVSRFSFTVERKILGVFQSDFLLYGGLALLVCILMIFLGHGLIKRRRTTRLTPFDYSNIPHSERTFYEILSDTIMEMRGRVGDDALDIAAGVAGLTIDKNTGRVLAITEHPSKVIAALVSEYEKTLGKKVSFSFRN